MNITVWCMSSILIRMACFSFYTIFISERYRPIVGSIAPVQQVGAILWNMTITVGFQSHIYRVTYYFVFMLENFTSQKYRNTLPSHYFFVPGASLWTAGCFKGLADCWLWGWFIVGNRPVLLWKILIWYGNYSFHELKPVLGI